MTESLSLYIHWPFCLSKCPYCDFNSHVAETIDQAAWCKALLEEMAVWATDTPGRMIQTMFFGGGTPSLMPPDTVSCLIEAADKLWGLAQNAEITLEANPTSVEAAKLAAFRSAGVNRLSLGVQSLVEADLRALGRAHSVEDARAAMTLAARVFDRWSFDLIYARPGQEVESWRAELTDALSLAGDHLSAYQLTVEPGTAFHRDRVATAEDALGAALFEMTQDILAAAGLPAYEISNHARPGSECRHNLVYWRGGDYLGLGPGAHGRLSTRGNTESLFNWRDPARWLAAQAQSGRGLAKRQPIEAAARAEELILMGLRLTDGLDAETFAARTGRSLLSSVDTSGLNALEEGGFLISDHRGIRATPAGRLCLNAVIAKLIP